MTSSWISSLKVVGNNPTRYVFAVNPNIWDEVFGLVNRFISVLIELNMTSLDMLVQLIPCHDSGCTKQENVGLAKEKIDMQ